jgi:hypothetical protein
MRSISKRLRRLEESQLAQKNEHGLTPVDVLRQRRCRRLAKEMGRSYEELLQESVMKSQAFWAGYDGDRSLVGILRKRFHRMGKPGDQTGQPGSAMLPGGTRMAHLEEQAMSNYCPTIVSGGLRFAGA